MITYGILSKVTNQMLDKRARCMELLGAVMSKIVSDPNSFWTFIAVLEEEPTFQVIAESMRKSYKTHEPLQIVQPTHSYGIICNVDTDCNDIDDGNPERKSRFQYFKKLSDPISYKGKPLHKIVIHYYLNP